jgi:hypothetical protein
MSDAPLQSRQEIIDQEHLKLLALFYYVMGGMYVVFSCFFLLYVFFGLLMTISPAIMHNLRGGLNAHDRAIIGYAIAGFGGCLVLLGWTFGGLTILAGRSIQTRRRRTLTFVMAALNCLSIPFGLMLGIFTFIVLSRHSVSRLYDAQAQ